MELDELLFFNQYPQLQPLYEALLEELLCRHPDVKVRVSKTQLSFYNRHLFAMVALPLRRKKDWPKVFLQLSFGLEYRLESPRIAVAVEPYPNRWTHHVLLTSPEQLDEELFGWLEEAYDFAQRK